MSGNTSASGGFLTPVISTSPAGAALLSLFHDTIQGITGIAGSLVRPRWQANPPQQPAGTVDWAAFGVTVGTPLDTPVIQQVNDSSAELKRQLYMELSVAIYGPNSLSNGQILLDGFAIRQNGDLLRANEIKLVGIGDLVAMPEITNVQWISHYETVIRFTQEVSRTYNIFTLTSASATLTADDGTTASASASPQ